MEAIPSSGMPVRSIAECGLRIADYRPGLQSAFRIPQSVSWCVLHIKVIIRRRIRALFPVLELFIELGMAAREGHLPAFNEEVADARTGFEQVAIGDNEVRRFARLN